MRAVLSTDAAIGVFRYAEIARSAPPLLPDIGFMVALRAGVDHGLVAVLHRDEVVGTERGFEGFFQQRPDFPGMAAGRGKCTMTLVLLGVEVALFASSASQHSSPRALRKNGMTDRAPLECIVRSR